MFVIVEGPNGAGKTTLIENLKNDGFKTLSSPNGTPLAQMLRSACRGTDEWTDIDKMVQFLLFSAARLDEYIRLVHGKSEVVVADRWWTSTYVYQCVLQGIPVEFMEYTKHPDEEVGLVIVLDADNKSIINRVKSERLQNPKHGKCRWTQDNDTVLELARIYRQDLPDYLSTIDIDCEVLDTSELTTEEVLEQAKILIEKYQ